MRCSAHILNMIIQGGLKEIENVIVKVCESVKYDKFPQSRNFFFMKIVKREKCSQKSLVLDVPTGWNSTYLMLDTAIEFEKVFSCLHLFDLSYIHTPSSEDWEKIKLLIECLNVFYEVTERLSGTKFSTSNLYFGDICIIYLSLRD
uniref:Putative AC transposase n=1 Tax=Anthurium amnicola TaxID=1678845 RepID=A0A1D1Z080_9ARAE